MFVFSFSPIISRNGEKEKERKNRKKTHARQFGCEIVEVLGKRGVEKSPLVSGVFFWTCFCLGSYIIITGELCKKEG